MKSLQFPLLIGDIGGTNARFALLADAQTPMRRFDNVRVADHGSIAEAIQSAVLSRVDTAPKTAIFAAAGPIGENGLKLTNSHWEIRPDSFLDFSPINDLILFNDFFVQAMALPFIDPTDLVAVGNGDAETRDDMSKAVIGPGTGLGVGGLIFADGRWVPVAGEGGHVDLGPRSRLEETIWQHLETVGGRISGESILSGAGIVNLYQAMCRTKGRTVLYDNPADVTDAALAGNDGDATEVMALFCTLLGRVAGDVALTFMARGGLYLAGGIPPKILPILKRSGFSKAFEDKAPHADLMKQIAVRVVRDDAPALHGLAGFAREPERFAIALEHRRWSRQASNSVAEAQ